MVGGRGGLAAWLVAFWREARRRADAVRWHRSEERDLGRSCAAGARGAAGAREAVVSRATAGAAMPLGGTSEAPRGASAAAAAAAADDDAALASAAAAAAFRRAIVTVSSSTEAGAAAGDCEGEAAVSGGGCSASSTHEMEHGRT